MSLAGLVCLIEVCILVLCFIGDIPLFKRKLQKRKDKRELRVTEDLQTEIRERLMKVLEEGPSKPRGTKFEPYPPEFSEKEADSVPAGYEDWERELETGRKRIPQEDDELMAFLATLAGARILEIDGIDRDELEPERILEEVDINNDYFEVEKEEEEFAELDNYDENEDVPIGYMTPIGRW